MQVWLRAAGKPTFPCWALDHSLELQRSLRPWGGELKAAQWGMHFVFDAGHASPLVGLNP